MTFNDLLREGGIDPTDVAMIRHSLYTEQEKIGPGKEYADLQDFTAHPRERFVNLVRRKYFAVFVSESAGGTARFQVLYRVEPTKKADGSLSLSETDFLGDKKGQLTITWSGRNSYQSAEKNDYAIKEAPEGDRATPSQTKSKVLPAESQLTSGATPKKEVTEDKKAVTPVPDLVKLYDDFEAGVRAEKVRKQQEELAAIKLAKHVRAVKRGRRIVALVVVILVAAGIVTANVNAANVRHANAQKQVATARQRLNGDVAGDVSSGTVRAAKNEEADTQKIVSKGSNSQLAAEKSRLTRLDKTAKNEKSAVSSLRSDLTALSQDSYTSSADKRALKAFQKSIMPYSSLSGLQGKANALENSVATHNGRNEVLSKAQKTLANKDLSDDEKNKINPLVSQLTNAKKLSDMKTGTKKLNSELGAARSQIQRAVDLRDAKKTAQSDVDKANQAISAPYCSDDDKNQLQADIDKINGATQASDVAAADSDLTTLISQVNSRTAAAKDKAETPAPPPPTPTPAPAPAPAAPAAPAGGGGFSTVSGWAVAAPGMCFLSQSNRYYSSVMNPGNYSYESVGEAQAGGAVAGRSNGYAHN